MMTARSVAQARQRWRVVVTGTVQGVGFRPFVYRLAERYGLTGWVTNAPRGVVIEVEGQSETLDAFVAALRSEPPPGARVVDVSAEALPPPPRGGSAFEIRASEARGARTVHLPADLVTCERCLQELLDPSDRRYRYPFTNCTDCGPRYSIIESLPYDRERTTMRRFAMCQACREEYANPASRRFHAEPNACPQCGPRLALWDAQGTETATGAAALDECAAMLRAGRAVALKGLGGFQLLVDAGNEEAVQRLRERKARPDKPLAVMYPSLADAEAACAVEPPERDLLIAPERPIVLLRHRAGAVAANVAPGNPWLGVMLPYTPLHHLLLAQLCRPVVATSGNRAGEPIAIDETEAVARLRGIADAFLVHDRPIVRPVDDSVVRVVAGQPLVLRRARGYSPSIAGLSRIPAGMLALGGHTKSTVALSLEGQVVLSQHLGDLDSPLARAVYRQTLDELPRLYGREPDVLVHDRHPDYHASRIAAGHGTPAFTVPHHVAHVAACMAEHDITGSVLGVAWDGSGYGDDGTVWGGEFLRIDDTGHERVAHLRPFRLPGGEAAVREPRRCALSLLAEVFGEDGLARTDLACVGSFSAPARETLWRLMERDINAPVTTSAGRLFDAVAALLGIRQRTTFEGQAAAQLEWAADGWVSDRAYTFAVGRAGADAPWIIDWEPVIRALLADLTAGVAVADMAAAFHDGLAMAIAAVAKRIGEPRVVLSGGCFQNARLTESTVSALTEAGFQTYRHSLIPPNDGGLALGQLAWAGRQTKCA